MTGYLVTFTKLAKPVDPNRSQTRALIAVAKDITACAIWAQAVSEIKEPERIDIREINHPVVVVP